MPVVLTILGDIFTLKERRQDSGRFQRRLGRGIAGRAGPGRAAGQYARLAIGPFSSTCRWARSGLSCWSGNTTTGKSRIRLISICRASFSWRLPARHFVAGIAAWPRRLDLVESGDPSYYRLRTTLWFIKVELRAANPILPPSLMVERSVGPALIGSCLLGIGFLSLDTYVPLYVQGAKGGGGRGGGERRHTRLCLPGRPAVCWLRRWSFAGGSAERRSSAACSQSLVLPAFWRAPWRMHRDGSSPPCCF